VATLSLDGPGEGETGERMSIRPDYEAAVTVVLDALRDRPALDLRRIGAVGVSLGGYYAPRAAAFELGVKAVAAIGGPYDFGECWPQLPSLTRDAFVHYSGARDDKEGQAEAAQLSLARVPAKVRLPPLLLVR